MSQLVQIIPLLICLNPSLTTASLEPGIHPGIIQITQIQIQLHNFNQKTLWFYDEPNFNQSESTTFSENVLSTLVSSAGWDVPLILGRFGKSIRTIPLHPHLTSFIFLAILEDSPKSQIQELEGFISENGNTRRDRFLFLSKNEFLLRNLFSKPAISGLKDKLGLIIPSTTDDKVLELLLVPKVYSRNGHMQKIRASLDDLSLKLANPPQMGRGLPGRHVKISGCLLPTWLYQISDETSPKGIQHDGSNYRTFYESSLKFNYTFELNAPPGQGYGALLPNGTWTGMAADLYYLERGYDVAILLGHVLGWYHFVDFASSLDFANLIFVTGHPSLATNSESFLLPFQTEVWFTIIGIYCYISFAVFCFLLLKQWMDIQRHDRVRSQSWTSAARDAAFQAVTIPYSVALEQALSKVPKNVRFVIGIWMIATIMTGTGYRCNLASFLSVPTPAQVPSTFNSLAEDESYSVVLNKLGVAEAQFFEFSENPTIQKIKKRLGVNPDPVDCATRAFLSGKMACISWTPLITAFASGALSINTRMDALIPSSEPALPVSMSIGFLKDSVIVDAFTPISSSLYETGLYRKWTDDGFYYFKLKGKAALEQADKSSELYVKLKEFEDAFGALGSVRPFNIGNLTLPFYGLLLGVGVAGLGFLVEILWANGTRLGRTRRDKVKIVRIGNEYQSSKNIEKHGKIWVRNQLGSLKEKV